MFQRFFHHYQMRLYDLMSDYTVQAKGPAAVRDLFLLLWSFKCLDSASRCCMRLAEGGACQLLADSDPSRARRLDSKAGQDPPARPRRYPGKTKHILLVDSSGANNAFISQEKIDEREQERENSNARQRQYQKDAANAQTEVGQQLVEVAKLQAVCYELANVLSTDCLCSWLTQ